MAQCRAEVDRSKSTLVLMAEKTELIFLTKKDTHAKPSDNAVYPAEIAANGWSNTVD